MTHTAGPWRMQPTSMKGQYLVQGGDIRSGDGFSLQFSESNARLIAAAPELLEALEDLILDAEKQMKNPSHHMLFSLPKARAALAKATGVS